jgi:hypothetical protein
MLKQNSQPFAEIIESSLQNWLGQSWEWDTFPQFGSIVTTESNNRLIFGIIHQVQTGSMDPIRYPFPYKKTEEELRREQPQIFEFLKTTFSCLTLGYQEHGKIHYLLAPEPPKIHSFVKPMSDYLAKQFFGSHNYLHMLFSMANGISNIDELLLAILKQQVSLNIISEDTLENFIQRYSLLIGNDYRRIKLFLQRAQPILEI